ncbi:aldehyde dehydrogenase [Desarmillaria tabescens]|uniref:Aldehyde dehydrogenase n=1 Tax=Armillaria tabescens TaxID=1929756 RepID=A0AA39JWN8_ARMTA|nr:aldehyde dehydrogenase [Desarmillaria tabescens]KAK0450310.1 aldehyde dehydrogenase [Desarmillaria tabescens]
MTQVFTYTFDTPTFKGTTKVNTSLFINGKFVDPIEGGSIEVTNPATAKVITSVAGGTKKDVDVAVKAAKEAFKKSWGLKCPGAQRGRYLSKLADLVEQNIDELAALETLNVGKPFKVAKNSDITDMIAVLRYYAGWADKIHGKVVETYEEKFSYTRHEPYGVVGQIVPWNFPMLMVGWKLGPALATGNTVVLKPSEITPLTAQRLCDFIIEAGFPPGVINVVNGYGNTVGQAISEHPDISKVAFTGSTLVGRKIQEASAKSNLKAVSLELGGKSPCIIFDDANIDQAVKWTASGIFSNAGQVCNASSRILLQESIYDTFVEKFAALAKSLQHVTGDPFDEDTKHGPQVSQIQFDRVMGYLDSAREEGAKFHVGGEKHHHEMGEGFFIQPTIFTGSPHMKAVKEEIFGPVAAIIKFKTEEEAIELANDSAYGLAAAVFSENSSRTVRVTHALEAGTAYVNCYGDIEASLPFGGYKQSGNGRELGEYALNMYSEIKAVHVNIGITL